jgi:hypothetical protein
LLSDRAGFSFIAKIVSETRPDPINTEPAINPEVPAVMSAILADAMYMKLITIPIPPARIERPAITRQTGRKNDRSAIEKPQSKGIRISELLGLIPKEES